MPNLKDIKRRIGTVAKTQQITRAMRMVAGAKLRRAQESIESARPYAERLERMVTSRYPDETDNTLLGYHWRRDLASTANRKRTRPPSRTGTMGRDSRSTLTDYAIPKS